MLPPFAHSLPDRPALEWEPLADHLVEVGKLAAANAGPSHLAGLARAAGLLHDIGKMSAAYQSYIGGDGVARGPDHATAGAREAVRLYSGAPGKIIAFAVAAHHTGLMNGRGDGAGGRSPLAHRLDARAYPVEPYEGWEAHVGGLPARADLKMSRPLVADAAEVTFAQSFLIRMLFSSLVDADFIATEGFYAAAAGGERPARGGVIQPRHRAALHAAFARRTPADTAINRLRGEILAHAVAKAGDAPGLFTLTVPTGGGKTLTSLAFALDHAARHGLRRVIYVIPFTSIIEQTAQIFRDALGPCAGDILEHHASFDWDGVRPASDDREGEGREGLAKLRRATENWDAPIVVTTAVQFYESLFAARTSRCRKLHNLANSVIILDEVQTIPVHLLRPCMAALDELQRNYGATVVLCTATQPALRQIDGALPRRDFPGAPAEGFAIGPDRELAPDPPRLYRELRRVRVERLAEPIADTVIVDRFGEQERMLCIVDNRRHARELFEAIRDQPGARHLTTLMCARHRRKVLAGVYADLKAQRPVRLIATSLIEAGVDVDFPEVWRAEAGLDSVAQAAGRCNREGKLEGLGRCVVFTPAGHQPPAAVRAFQAAGRAALRWAEPREADLLGHAAVTEYFRHLYFLKGYAALDAAPVDGKPFPIMPAIDQASNLDFPFASIAEAFRLIDDTMEPMLIPYDTDAEAALATLAAADRPPRDVLRRLQQVSVPVPAKNRLALIAAGAAVVIRERDFGDRFVRLVGMDLYDDAFGLRLDEPTFRNSESNVI